MYFEHLEWHLVALLRVCSVLSYTFWPILVWTLNFCLTLKCLPLSPICLDYPSQFFARVMAICLVWCVFGYGRSIDSVFIFTVLDCFSFIGSIVATDAESNQWVVCADSCCLVDVADLGLFIICVFLGVINHFRLKFSI